jgi:hypothetical protein
MQIIANYLYQTESEALKRYQQRLEDLVLGSVDKNFNVTILKLQQNLKKLKRWLGLYRI